MAILTEETSGMSHAAFYRAARGGSMQRVGRGIYLPEEFPPADFDQIEASTKRPDATICLDSALAQHDLTDTIPAELHVAIFSQTHTPITEGAIAWHKFDRKTFNLGRELILIAGTDMTIGCYSAERSIIDAFRMRGEIGYETGRDALKEWLRRGGKPSEILKLAEKIPRAKTPLLFALEMLS